MNTYILWLTVHIEVILLMWLLVAAPFMLWCDYLAVMNLKKVRDSATGLSSPAKTLGTYVLFRGYILDAFVNVFHMTILLRELPKELTVTGRITRHIETGSGWQHDRCLYIRITYLDGFDPAGIHH